MNTDPVTLPFLTWQGLNTLLAGLGLAGTVGLVWAMLHADQRRAPMTLEGWIKALGVALLPVWLWVLGATLWGLWLVFNGMPSPLVPAGLGRGSSLGLGALIAALLGAPFVVYGTYLRHKTQRLEQEGHMTDRITKAVEQLGAHKIVKRDGKEESVPNIEVRMGAILSLERIAQDSTANDKGRDHVRVMEILCAYIRVNSNSTEPEDYPEPKWEPLSENATIEQKLAHRQETNQRFGTYAIGSRGYNWARNLNPPREDVNLAVKVIARRTSDQREVERKWNRTNHDEKSHDTPRDVARIRRRFLSRDLRQGIIMLRTERSEIIRKLRPSYGFRIDLTGSNLQGIQLINTKQDEHEYDLSHSVLVGCRFEGASLSGLKLVACKMDRCKFIGSNMLGTDLSLARGLDVDFEATNLARAVLFGSHWTGFFGGAQLIQSCFDLAYLGGQFVGGARLDLASFISADIRGSRFEIARLDGTCFDGANIWWTHFNSISATKPVSFKYSCFKDVDLTCVPHQPDQLEIAFGDASVALNSPAPKFWPAVQLVSEINLENPLTTSKQYMQWLSDPASYKPPE